MNIDLQIGSLPEPRCGCGHMLTRHKDRHVVRGKEQPPSCKDCACSYDWRTYPLAYALFGDGNTGPEVRQI